MLDTGQSFFVKRDYAQSKEELQQKLKEKVRRL